MPGVPRDMKANTSKPGQPLENIDDLFIESDTPDISSKLEHREHRRITIELQAELVLSSNTQECTTADLSAGGVKLKVKDGLFKNVRINILNAGEIPGEIVWLDGDYVGIKFNEDESEIINVLHRITS